MIEFKRKIKTRFIAGLFAVVLSTISLSSVVYAYTLTEPESFYNGISWTWFYSDEARSSYNCLGFATGSMTWEWPNSWGEGATKSQLDSYLAKKGYRPYEYDPFILAYGPSSNKIVHFSKVTGLEWCRSKWGSLELFNHGSHDPYYHSSPYGALQYKYTAN